MAGEDYHLSELPISVLLIRRRRPIDCASTVSKHFLCSIIVLAALTFSPDVVESFSSCTFEYLRDQKCYQNTNLNNLKSTIPLFVRANEDRNLLSENIILWRGEDTKGYSAQFRHLEFSNALAVVVGKGKAATLQFSDAVSDDEVSDDFLGALQYVTINENYVLENDKTAVDQCMIVEAAERCSLVRDVYEIVAEGDEYGDLSRLALVNGSLKDLMKGGSSNNASWCLRLRQYGNASIKNQEKKPSEGRHSPLTLERQALDHLAPLLDTFGGSVRLKDPDCALYIFEGLKGRKKVLARKLATGPKTSVISPRTRICVTNTPLCPIASFIMCNVGRVQDGQNLLDPFAGSCTTLLAASMIAPRCRTVGIEVADEEKVNRNDIRNDFRQRNLPLPAALLHGDCTSTEIRNEARLAIGGDAFDVILTDPPYGLREKVVNHSDNENPPLVQLVMSIAQDLEFGTPLLKRGGRLVTFIPSIAGEDMTNEMPTKEQLKKAGLEIIEIKKQPLSDNMSRWLVIYIALR